MPTLFSRMTESSIVKASGSSESPVENPLISERERLAVAPCRATTPNPVWASPVRTRSLRVAEPLAATVMAVAALSTNA
jgi:hypothetical protein